MIFLSISSLKLSESVLTRLVDAKAAQTSAIGCARAPAPAPACGRAGVRACGRAGGAGGRMRVHGCVCVRAGAGAGASVHVRTSV